MHNWYTLEGDSPMFARLGRNKAEVAGFVSVGLNAAAGVYAVAHVIPPFAFQMAWGVGTALCAYVIGQRCYEKSKPVQLESDKKP